RRARLVRPDPKGPDARRLLHVQDRRDAGAGLREGGRRLPWVRGAAGRPEGVGAGDRQLSAAEQQTYDAIVVGSGMTGGWAAKELTEAGLRQLALERGRAEPR